MLEKATYILGQDEACAMTLLNSYEWEVHQSSLKMDFFYISNQSDARE